MGDPSLPRDVSRLLAWVEAATPGTLVPTGELAERIRELPVASTNGGPQPEPDEGLQHLLTADDVADWLSCDRQRVYRMARDGRLPSVRIGQNTVRFRRADVERWIERRAE